MSNFQMVGQTNFMAQRDSQFITRETSQETALNKNKNKHAHKTQKEYLSLTVVGTVTVTMEVTMTETVTVTMTRGNGEIWKRGGEEKRTMRRRK